MNQRTTLPDYNIYLARRTFEPSGEPFIPPSDEATYYFIQFNKPLTENDRKRLKETYKLHLNYYVPNLAFLEPLNFEKWRAVSQDELYRASAPYRPSDKISPQIESCDDRAQPGEDGIRLRALLFPGTKDEVIDNIARVIEALSVKTSEETERGAVRKLDDRHLGGHFQLIFTLPSTEPLLKIAEIQEIQWIEEVTELRADACSSANLVAGTVQSGTPGVTPLWEHDINGKDQIIGIIDGSLINLAHCMFRDNGTAIGNSHRKIVGYRPGTGQLDAHAAAVASIAAGDEINNSGMNNSRGIAWRARLSFDNLTIIHAGLKSMLNVLNDERQDGASIHSNSWHDNTTNYNETAFEVDQFVWLHEHSFVCASTANSNQSEALGPPGTAKNALCVSASRRHPNQRKHSDGKSGPTPDDRRKPEICAPGCGINAATTDNACVCSPPNGCATSWATPVIAGAAALVRQYYMEGFHRAGVQDLSQTHTPTAALIKATLLNSTIPMVPETDYPNRKTGWGLVKLDNTLFFAGSPHQLFVEDVLNAEGLDTGHARTHYITVMSQEQPLKITLVWSDPPAQVNTGKAPVHDLNLIVTSPNGADVYLGNAEFFEGFSKPRTPASVPDGNNNVEMVIVKEPAPGLWTITVECVQANLGKQGYALVATGALG